MDLSTELSKKIGPFPLWLLLGAGGGVLLLLLHGGGGGGGTSPASSTSTDPNAGAGALDTSGLDLGGGAGAPLDLGSLVGGNSGGFEDPIATPDTSAPSPVGGSPDGSTTVQASPITLDPYAQAVVSSTGKAGDPNYDLIAQELPQSQSAQGFQLEKTILSNPTFDYSALNAALGIPTTDEITAQLNALLPSNDQLFGNTPTFDSYAGANAGAIHVLAQPSPSPAGVVAFATTPQTAQPNENVVVQASTASGAPADTHPSLTPRPTPGTAIAV